MFNFDNTYAQLPEKFFASASALTIPKPRLLKFNHEFAEQLGVQTLDSSDELASIFSGQTILKGSQPIALAYAGHQFGHFVPKLGDGRAILLGEIVGRNKQRYDIQLKGAGRTPFSRGGDGRCPLGPAIREYIISEAMYALGVPTTRALALVTTGDFVHRNSALPGAVFTRVASSHIRIGTFEYFALQGDNEAVKILADYAIDRHYPQAKSDANPYLAFFKEVICAQTTLITKWMSLGFIHGVMNTDNTSISGETIDYGPCAFMDEFNFQQVFSSIDYHGRYSYSNQAAIILWNLSRLGDCLVPLVDSDSKKAITVLEEELSAAHNKIESNFVMEIAAKIGIERPEMKDETLVTTWLQYLQTQKYDYTLSFRELATLVSTKSVNRFFEKTSQFNDFLDMWRIRIKEQTTDDTQEKMNNVNPVFIPRNHQVERAITQAINNDFSVFEELNQVLQNPYKEQSEFSLYKQAPQANEKITATFCGT
ncbi:YdiU family protein [Candidatus Uabimicrobium helgolandensis]